MIEKQILRKLVLEVCEKTPRTEATSIINDVERLVATYDLFPSSEDCQKLDVDHKYYQQKNLHPNDQLHILDIIWDLIVERVITPGRDQSNVGFPFVRLTPFGLDVMSQSVPHYHDPDAYIAFLKSTVPSVDPTIVQYVSEGINCFKRQLFFASAVMLGAAAEKGVLLLLEAIAQSMSDPVKKKEAEQLLERGRLPTIYSRIRETLAALTENDTIPYTVHQGCNEHLVSLYEMIRVQRNDAVHPVAGNVDKAKVFLSLQTLPVALELTYKLIDWLGQNTIP